MSSDELKIFIGLGNPGAEYVKTRHNIGFMVVKEIARLNNSEFRQSKKFFGKICEIGIADNKKRLLMPTTFMNESGRSIRAAKDWFGLDNNELLVLVDDMDLPLGKIRLRSKGSSGGHNGLKSIIKHLGTNDFNRLKIGIGPPSSITNERKMKTVSHVLGRFSSDEIPILNSVIKEIIIGIELLQTNGWEKASTRLNSYKPDIL